MLSHLRIRRWSRLWLALVVPLMVVLGSTPAHAVGDTTAPSTPADLRVSYDATKSPYSAQFDWSPSTDASGISGYAVYVNGQLTQSRTDTRGWAYGLYSRNPYTVSVVAYDRAGNKSAPATATFTASGVPGPVPTTPQNLRANYVNGHFDSFTWDPSAFAGGKPWYTIYIKSSTGASDMYDPVWHTTVTLQELIGSLYLDFGHTYTIKIVAWGHMDGKTRPSDYSETLTVKFPDFQTW